MEIKERQIRDLAQVAATRVYQTIISSTDIDRVTAVEVSKKAGNALLARLELELVQHGVEIVREMGYE